MRLKLSTVGMHLILDAYVLNFVQTLYTYRYFKVYFLILVSVTLTLDSRSQECTGKSYVSTIFQLSRSIRIELWYAFRRVFSFSFYLIQSLFKEESFA